ncbi:putative FmdB family regulatory protein [Micrococcus cohnii]|uniref:Putative FmdB family regulatory protein n=1 Tax=Micrococcus cohnii TaxID=993416 RepID=A0A7W7GP22_9MICC|nr:FmdB family zinc ribbon protein [Micrococcus cohnii]MBB4735655.1 putative FmdB family regulatory protein [Micrococcus cohnii]
MPTYAYRCKDCTHAFDVVQSFTDDSLTRCPECGGTLRKQFGSVGVTFKGSGFYRTDSRSNSSGSSGSGASGAGSSDGGTSSSSGSSSSDSGSTGSGSTGSSD